jgi:hypothetical protein
MSGGMGWLAAFGLTHGFFEWGLVFIPVQATYLAEPVIVLFDSLHAVLLALSFTFLFQFGVEMLHKRWRRIVAIPLLVMVAWIWGQLEPGAVAPAGFDLGALPDRVSGGNHCRDRIAIPGGTQHQTDEFEADLQDPARGRGRHPGLCGIWRVGCARRRLLSSPRVK